MQWGDHQVCEVYMQWSEAFTDKASNLLLSSRTSGVQHGNSLH